MHSIKISYSIFLLFFLGSTLHSIGQYSESAEYGVHKVKIKKDRFVFSQNQVFYTHNDTVVYFADTVDFYVKRNSMGKTDEFYELVETNMSKGSVSQALYDVVFNQENANGINSNYASQQRFNPYTNDTLKRISIKQLPIFGTSIHDTTLYNTIGFTHFLNKVNISTRPSIIRKNLTFSEGDLINPNDMVDSERILRSLNYIKDARIYISDTNEGDAKARVVTKDLFPWSIVFSPSHSNISSFGIVHTNILGLGHEFEYDFVSDADLQQGRGSDLFYRVKSIQGTYIDIELNYAHTFSSEGFGVSIDRQFVTQDIKYAGGFQASNYKHGELSYYDSPNDTTDTFFYKEKLLDGWLGRAFHTNTRLGVLGIANKPNLVISVRDEYSDFLETPFVTADSNYRFHDYQNILFGVGLSSRKFYTDQFILNFGRTEDIPSGGALGLVTGYQFGEFVNRPYLGFNYARGTYLRQFGYVNFFSEIGGFLSGENFYQDAVLKIGVDYFTRLFPLNQYKFRQYISSTWTEMINPREALALNTQSEIRIRGTKRYLLYATDMFNIQTESLFFTPINLIGFRMAWFAYADYTMVKDEFNSDQFDHYLGVGFGVRLRNENLAFQTLSFRFSFFPMSPNGAHNLFFNLSSSSPLKIRDFSYSAPATVSF